MAAVSIIESAQPEQDAPERSEVQAMTTPIRKPRRKAEQRAESLEQLLDAAEELFSRHGFYGVTVRDIAEKVGVHKSLIHYYFADKQEVFDKVMARRAPVTSGRRMEALDAYEKAAGGKPTVEGALRAFLDTDLDTYSTGGDGWRHFGALSAQINNTPVWGAEVMDRLYDPVVLRLIGLLKQAMPEAAEEDIFWGYHFVTGALTLSLARTGRIDHLSGGKCKSDDFDAIKERMASFMAHGFIGICRDRAAERRRLSGE
ncbi:TetR/AcrR family transcriptional regulator [Brevundimonas kwangchunensis]|uniref:TetR/AcrR family transcriptional regulator n=2 Tax=Brevundimonas kwangchunensis TaxID=322163 RepID=A0ABN1H557_9CAUL